MIEMKSYVFGFCAAEKSYELLCICPTLTRGCQMSRMIVQSGKTSKNSPMHRLEDEEPFDQLIIARSTDPENLHMVFSEQYPDGFQPPF